MTKKIGSISRDEPIILQIHRLSRSILRTSTAEYMHAFGLGVPQAQILNALGTHRMLSSKEIADHTAMNKALVSRSLSELTDLGYTTISADAADARRSLWQLTSKGEEFVVKFRPMRLARRARLLKALTPDERTLLIQFIEKLIVSSENMGRQEAAARRAQGKGRKATLSVARRPGKPLQARLPHKQAIRLGANSRRAPATN
jgi:DNA-binding MarR family transcriptional regulator